MAQTKQSTREKFEEAVKKAAEPVPVEEREQPNETILYGEDAVLDTHDYDVEIVETDGSAVAPEVHVVIDGRQDEASVLMPPEGIGVPNLPGWALIDGERVEDVFARDAGEQQEVDEQERSSAAAQGTTPREKGVEKASGSDKKS
jgi:hypothetical protein